MSFFYDLNKKLDGIRATPEVTHKQLNERDMSRAAKGYEKYGKEGMEALAKAGREGKALDPVRAKYDKYDNTEVDEGQMLDKFVNSKIGQKILGKPSDANKLSPSTAGHSFGKGQVTPGGPLGQIARSNMNKNEGAHSQDAMALNPDFDKIGRKPGVMGKIGSGLKKVADVLAPGDDELLDRLQKSSGAATRQPGAKEPRYMEAMSPAKQKSFAALAPPTDKITFADKIAGAKKEVDEMLGDVAAEAMKNALSGGQKKLDKNDNGQLDANDFAMLRKGAGKKSMEEAQDATTYTVAYKDPKKPGKSYSTQVKATSAAEAKAAFQDWDDTGRFTYLGSRPDVDKVHEASTGNAFDYKSRREPETQKSASRIHKGTYGTEYDGDKDDAKALAAKKKAAVAAGQATRGRGRPKRNADSDTGQVMKPDFSAFGVTGKDIKLPKHKGAVTKHKMVGEDDLDPKNQGEYDQEGDMAKEQMHTIMSAAKELHSILRDDENLPEWVQKKITLAKEYIDTARDYMLTQHAERDEEQPIAEKAVSKKQQRFMGMVHATQKGEKPASGAVAKVAKSMGKKDAEDFAATKHKGLPEKKKPEGKKNKEEDVEESTTSGSVATSTAAPKAAKGAGGFTFGKGIYDSMNREVEDMIAESMSINMSMNNDANGPTRSLTVTATDDDATKLAQLLKSAGLGGAAQETCSACGSANCGCDAVDESYGDNSVAQNSPDYPTNTETAQDNFEYSGGLNKPKSTGQTTVPVIASQEERQYTNEGQGPSDAERLDHYHDLKASGMNPDEAEAEAYGTDDWYNDMNEQDPIDRMMEMAGINNNAQLDEGMMDKLKSLVVPKLMKLLGPDAVDIANAVKQATGGDLSPTKENAMRVVQALGIDKAAAQGQSPQMAEGIAGNWQGKLRQALYTVGLLGSAGAASAMAGTPALIMGVIGVALLMMADAVFGSGPGSVGVMGKFGNKGTSTQRGLDIHGSPITNTNVDESDDLSRMMEMAGVKKKAVEEEKTEEGNKFTGNLAKARADGKKETDLDGDGDMEKVRESIFTLTNQWKAYKG
jgi:hypothetical protein